jgi:WD40 repeat protein
MEQVYYMLGSGRLHVTFLSDGKRIITTYNDDIRIWDAETGKEVRKVVLQGLYRERGQ